MLTDTALTQTEENKVHDPEQPWSDEFAAKIVSADFHTAETYRRYHDERWALADRLYFGWEPQRTWEGTKQPRSSLSSKVVFQQIETLLPRIITPIFSDNPWFEAGPQPGTTAEEAQDVRDLMLYQMEQCRKYDNVSFREAVTCAGKSGLMYGAGIVELSWTDYSKTRKKYGRQQVGVTRMQNVPGFGYQERPTGETQPQIVEREETQRRQGPKVKYVSVNDFYIDPNCPGPQVQLARYACTRALMTVDQLKAMRDKENFDIPSDLVLLYMATQLSMRQGDQTKSNQEASRGNNYQPTQETSADPGSRRIEVITYWTADRCVWVANPGMDPKVLYNQPNPYGFIPLFNIPYTPVPNRFYGLSVVDVTESEHRFQSGVLNARNDELAISIHPTRIKRRGANLAPSQVRRRPGQIIEAENPKEDIVTEQVQNITQDAYIESDASERRVSKTVGINDTFGSGTPQAGGNSANRTAAGINAQGAAVASRLTFFVAQTEDNFIEPLLTAWHQMNTIFLDPQEMIDILRKKIDPLRVLNADVSFYMRASSKMRAQSQLMNSFPQIAQVFMNPPLMDQLNNTGWTLDFKEFMTIFTDMTGWSSEGELMRPLTPQEQQAIKQAKEQQQNAELQLQRERMQSIGDQQAAQSQADMAHMIVETTLEAELEPEEKPAPKAKKK